jgi:hypothetical protein
MRNMKRLIWLTMAIGFAQAAAAQEENRGPYLGLSLGSFNYEQDNGALGIFVDDSTSAYRIIGGYRVSDHFAVEAGWGETGDLEDNTPFSNLTVDIQGEYEVLTVRALGIVPLGKRVSLYGGLGFYDAEFDATITVNNLLGPYVVEDRAEGATLVGGIEFNVERMHIRTEIEKFDSDEGSDAWDISIGVLFKF